MATVSEMRCIYHCFLMREDQSAFSRSLRADRFDLTFHSLFVQVIFSFQLKVAAQVETAYLFIFRQFFGCAMLEDLSIDQQVGAVADGEGFIYVVVGDEDTDVPVFEPGHHGLNIFYGDGVNTGKGLIQEDEFGVYGQCTGDFRTAAFTTT